jgi:competence protein ComEC
MRGRPTNTDVGAPLRGWQLAMLLAAPMAGALLQMQQSTLWAAWAYLAVALIAAASGTRWRKRCWVVCVALVALSFATTGWRAHQRLADALAPELVGADVQVTGVVSSLPRELSDGIRFDFDVQDAVWQGRAAQLPQRISLGWYRGWGDEGGAAPTVRAGQRWRFAVRLKPPHGLMNPHGFDYELWAFEQGIRATGYVRAQPEAVLLHDAAAHPVQRMRQAVREAIQRRIADPRAAGLLAALAVGDQAAIERQDWEVFRNTGIAHLVSISGLHVTMFAWLLAACVAWLWRRSTGAMHLLPAAQAARWGGLLGAVAYALLAGWGVPAQRTVWMLAAAVLLRSLGLAWPGGMVLLAAGAVVSVADPWALLQPGFWLSFGAVGLLLMIDGHTAAARVEAWPQRAIHAVRQGLRTQGAISLGLAPMSMVLFQQVSLVGFAANLLAIPLVTLLITPLALLGMLVPPAWQAAAWIVQALMPPLQSMASWPWATWSAAAAPLWVQSAALAAGALVILPLPWTWRFAAVPLAWPLFAMPSAAPAQGQFELWLPDVGQGGAAMVRTARHALLYDAGPQYSRDSEAGTRVLAPLLRAQGVRQIDHLMLSHRDNDHVGGAAAVLAAVPVRALSSSLEPTHPLLQGGVPHAPCRAGQAWQWDGVGFEVLHPPASATADAKPNTASCVLKVSTQQGRSVLLTGDIEAAQEAGLVQASGEKLKSTVLVLPHHGSKTSSSDGFLQAVAPQTAFAQAGWRNRFGHPAPEVVARVQAQGIELLRSDRCGAWQWSSEAATSPQCERLSAARQRYWRHHVP